VLHPAKTHFDRCIHGKFSTRLGELYHLLIGNHLCDSHIFSFLYRSFTKHIEKTIQIL
jgi:hypothetical protein